MLINKGYAHSVAAMGNLYHEGLHDEDLARRRAGSANGGCSGHCWMFCPIGQRGPPSGYPLRDIVILAMLASGPQQKMNDVMITPSDVYLHLPNYFKLFRECLPGDCGGGFVPRPLKKPNLGVVRLPSTGSIFCPGPLESIASLCPVYHPPDHI